MLSFDIYYRCGCNYSLITNILCPPYSCYNTYCSIHLYRKSGTNSWYYLQPSLLLVLQQSGQLPSICCSSSPDGALKSCANEASAVKHVGRMFGGRGREHHFHLEVAAGQDGHPLLPLQDVDDAAGPAHLCCQRGRGRLVAPPSFGWVAYGNSRGHLDLVMAWSGSWPENVQSASSPFSSDVRAFDFVVWWLPTTDFKKTFKQTRRGQNYLCAFDTVVLWHHQ